ncbi:MAG: hypothetical protein D3911_04085 [Candidatus Electrothrix sp. AW3_4]|nr:hypothetical protein [Candidatus Electrothrix gigas]
MPYFFTFDSPTKSWEIFASLPFREKTKYRFFTILPLKKIKLIIFKQTEPTVSAETVGYDTFPAKYPLSYVVLKIIRVFF